MSKYETRGEAIKDLRKKAGLSQEELAKKLNTTKQTIYKYESGIVTNIPSDKIEAMSRIFGVSPAVIMGWDTGIKLNFHLFGEQSSEEIDKSSTPVYEAAAGSSRLNDGYPNEELNIRLEPEEFVFRVVGRSMENTLLDGDIVIISAQSVPDYNGQMCLVKINGNESVIKRVEIKDNGLLLIGDNTNVYAPHFYSAEEVEQLPVRVEGVVTKLIRDIE